MNDRLGQFASVVLSAIVHMLVIIPLLAAWMTARPTLPPGDGPVSVHLSAPPAAPPQQHSGKSGGGSHGSSAPPPVVRHRRPARTEPVAVTQPAARPQTHVQTAPSIDKPSYPTAPRGGSQGQAGQDGQPAGSDPGQAGNGPGPGANDPGPPGPPPGLPPGPPGGTVNHQFSAAQPGAMPTNVPVPPFLQNRDVPRFEMKLEVSIDPTGHAKVHVYQSSGQAELDQLIVQQFLSVLWKPALQDGRPVASTQLVILTGDFKRGTQTFSIYCNSEPPKS